MTDPAARAARAAATILAPDYGASLAAQVEAVLAARHAEGQRPWQYDPVAIASLGVGAASLIVTIAQLAWTIYSERRNHTPDPQPNAIARQIRITLREQDIVLPPGIGRITEIIATEITSHPGDQ